MKIKILLNIKSVYDYIELNSTIVGYNIRMISFKFNCIIYHLSKKMQFVWTNALGLYLISAYTPLSFFANTPFNVAVLQWKYSV